MQVNLLLHVLLQHTYSNNVIIIINIYKALVLDTIRVRSSHAWYYLLVLFIVR